MRVTIIGGGYVGLVQAAIMSDIGHEVVCCERDHSKLQILNAGQIPIYEPGLAEIIATNFAKKRLKYQSDLEAAVRFADVIFICVGTPPRNDGSPDMSMYWEVFNHIIHIKQRKNKIIVNKSTVPVGTAKAGQALIASEKSRYHVVSNPEFLREGCAVFDAYNADRIVIGASGYTEASAVEELYRDLNRPTFICDTTSAELIKYASNSFLATKISFINYVAEMCEAYGGDVEDVARGMGMDNRIGPQFLRAGIGYGGSCFGKDVDALIHASRQVGIDSVILDATKAVNTDQPLRFVKIVEEALGGLQGRTIAMWGLAFKAGTDDIRDSKAIEIAEILKYRGAIVNVHDPVAMTNAAKSHDLRFFTTHLETVLGADALIVATDWDIYKSTDMEDVKSKITHPFCFDGRNIFDPIEMQNRGWQYYGIGRSNHSFALQVRT